MEKGHKDEKAVQVETEDNGNFDRSWRDETWFGGRALSVAAAQNDEDEKAMTTREAIRVYKKAILWSLVISTCVIMEGYDTKSVQNTHHRSDGLLTLHSQLTLKLLRIPQLPEEIRQLRWIL